MSRRLSFSPWPIALFLAAIVTAICVFGVTQSVRQHESRIAEINRSLLEEQQAQRVLEAEWAYLTRPQRLEELMTVRAESAVMPPAPAPIATVIDAAPALDKTEPAAGAQNVAADVPLPAKKKEAKAAIKKAEDRTPAPQPVKTAKKESIDVWPINRAPVRRAASAPVYNVGVARPILE